MQDTELGNKLGPRKEHSILGYFISGHKEYFVN